MASTMSTEPPFGRAREDDSSGDDDGEEVMEVRRRVSRFAVDADSGAGGASEVARRRVSRFAAEERGGAQVRDRRRGAVEALPPPHAWLAVEETAKSTKKGGAGFGSENEEQWARLLQRGGSAQADAQEQQRQPRRSSFSVARRTERGAREAWLDRAWEMKRSWHERNGGAPDADTPVVVVVGTKQPPQHGGCGSGTSSPLSSSCSSPHRHGGHAAAGVAMDMEEVRACRDLGLELPSDCTVEIHGISGSTSPTHSGSGSGSGSPSTPGSCSISSPSAGEDPVDVKARLKVWAQAVALASTTHLGS